MDVSAVVSLVDHYETDESDEDPADEAFKMASPLHGLQEYFDKQFSDVQRDLSTKLNKASELLARRIKVLRSMHKQHTTLSEENHRLSSELSALRKMIAVEGNPSLKQDAIAAGRRNSGSGRRTSGSGPALPKRSGTPTTPSARRNSHSSTHGHRRHSHSQEPGAPRRNSITRSGTPSAEKRGAGPTMHQTSSLGGKNPLPKDMFSADPVLPGAVTSNGGPREADMIAYASNLSPVFSEPRFSLDQTDPKTTAPTAPQPQAPVAPAVATAPVLLSPALSGTLSGRSSVTFSDEEDPPRPATNNFMNSEGEIKEPPQFGEPPLLTVFGPKEALNGSPKDGSWSERNASKDSSLQLPGTKTAGGELANRASVEEKIISRHSQDSSPMSRLRRSMTAPLEDTMKELQNIPARNFLSPDPGAAQNRSRKPSILKPAGAKREGPPKNITIVPVFDSEISEKSPSDMPSSSSSDSDEEKKALRKENGSPVPSNNSGNAFEVLWVWSKQVIQSGPYAKGDLRRRQSVRKMSRLMFDSAAMEELLKQHEENPFCRICLPFLLSPNSLKRACWDVTSFKLLTYDMITIPFELFEPPHTDFSSVMLWICRLFWTLDMWLSCFTGYIANDGSIEMRPRFILWRYAKSWLFLDLVLVGLDWMELFWIGSSSAGFARLGKASRAFRILRMLRMLRVIRLNQVIQFIDERIRSDRLMIFADTVKILLMILVCAHFSACVWYGIGVRDEGRTWVKATLLNSDSLAYRYFLCLHWSVSQFAGGMDEVVPHNLAERVFAVGLWISAFMMAAVLTSSLTSEITRLQIISNQHAQQLSILRRFLSDKGVSNKLSVRVQRNARHVLQQQQRYMRESSVELLELVSEPLRMELHFEVYLPLLVKHPFFNQYIEECAYVMRKVCHCCASMTPVFVGDVIFNAGEAPRPPKMYFVASGMQEYFTIGGNQVTVREGMWLSEATLWTSWVHRGGLRVKMDSQLCEFSAERFQDIVGDSDFSLFDPRSYAEAFVKLLNTYDGGISDLPFPREVLEEAAGIHKKKKHESVSEQVYQSTTDPPSRPSSFRPKDAPV